MIERYGALADVVFDTRLGTLGFYQRLADTCFGYSLGYFGFV